MMDNKFPILRKGLVIFFFLFALLGCGGMEKKFKAPSFPRQSMAKKPKSKEKQSWKELKDQKGKSFSQRIKNIEAFIQANEDKEIALDAYLLKARVFLDNKKYKSACSTYHKAVLSPFDYTGRWEAYHASAKCYFEDGKLKQAFEILERLIQNPKAYLKNKKAAAKLQWTFLKNKKGFTNGKLLSLSHLLLFSSHHSEKQKWRNKGETLIRGLAPGDLLLYANQADFFGHFEGFLLYRAGKYFFEKKKMTRAKRYFKRSLSSSLPLKLKKEIQQNLVLIKKISKVNPYLIGALIPLSGRRKALGEKILRGLYLGLDLEKDSSWQVLVVDSKSHPDVIRTQLDNLFYRHNVIGLVGGLTSETAEVMAEKADSFATPAILFSQKKDLSLNRSFVFQNAVTAEQLLKPLVQELVEKLKVKKAAVLYPDDLYGREYTKLFSTMFKKRGGRITELSSYKTGEVDFKKSIRDILHLNIKGREKEFYDLKEKFLKENPSLSERSRKLTPENLLSPKMDFSALFIPDSLDQMRKIKDHLKYFGLKDVHLLGTDLWSVRQISEKSEELPLLFVNLPEKDDTLVKNSLFYKEFINSQGHKPGLFEQRAYNSAVFLKLALSQGVKSRLSLQKELKKIKAFQGAYYKIFVSEKGVFHYPLNIYKTSAKKAHTLDSVPVK